MQSSEELWNTVKEMFENVYQISMNVHNQKLAWVVVFILMNCYNSFKIDVLFMKLTQLSTRLML